MSTEIRRIASRAGIGRIGGTIVCAALSLASVASGLDTTAFPYVCDLEAEAGNGAAGIAVCEINEVVFDLVDRDFGNLRIADTNGVERPLVVRVKRATQWVERTIPHAVETQDFRVADSNKMEIVVFFKDWRKHPIDGVRLRSPLRNFEKQVSVYAGEDLAARDTLCLDLPVFDYTRFIDMRNETVSFASVSRPYYRIVVSNIAEEHRSPVTQIAAEMRDGSLAAEFRNASFVRHEYRVDEIELIETRRERTQGTLVEQPYGVQNLSVAVDNAERVTAVSFRTRLTPVAGIVVHTQDGNFVRAVEVEARGEVGGADDQPWQRVGRGRIERLSIAGFKTERLTVPLDRVSRFREYRLTIRDGDSLPLHIEGVSPMGPSYELVFHNTDSEKHRLFFGGKDVAAPRYDIADVLQKADGAGATVFRLSLSRPNLAFEARGSRRLNARTALTVAIVLMVLLLTWAVATAARRLGA